MIYCKQVDSADREAKLLHRTLILRGQMDERKNIGHYSCVVAMSNCWQKSIISTGSCGSFRAAINFARMHGKTCRLSFFINCKIGIKEKAFAPPMLIRISHVFFFNVMINGLCRKVLLRSATVLLRIYGSHYQLLWVIADSPFTVQCTGKGAGRKREEITRKAEQVGLRFLAFPRCNRRYNLSSIDATLHQQLSLTFNCYSPTWVMKLNFF